MLKAVIFDMDGTLISTEEFHKQSAISAIQSFGILEEIDEAKVKRATTRSSGTTNQRSMEIILEEFGLDIPVKELMKRKAEELMKIYQSEKNFALIDGVKELIEALHAEGYPMAVASSSPHEEILYITERFGIDRYFDLLFSGEFVERSKPEPDIFLATAKKLSVQPQHCLVFEDSQNGVQAARSAGMFTVGYNNPQTPHYDLRQADLQINSFQEINPQILREKFNF